MICITSKETKLPARVTCSQKRKPQPLAKRVTKKSKVLKPAVTTPEEMKGLSSLTLKNKKRKSLPFSDACACYMHAALTHADVHHILVGGATV